MPIRVQAIRTLSRHYTAALCDVAQQRVSALSESDELRRLIDERRCRCCNGRTKRLSGCSRRSSSGSGRTGRMR